MNARTFTYSGATWTVEPSGGSYDVFASSMTAWVPSS